MLEHPDISRTLETGYPQPYSKGLHCDICGGGIQEDEPYYDILGTVVCEDCMERMKRYA